MILDEERAIREHLDAKAELHEVALAAHLVYDHGQPKTLPGSKQGLTERHAAIHLDGKK